MSTRSVKTALTVLEAVAERQPCGLSDLTRHLGLPKTTVQRCLVTLSEAGWIRLDNQDIARWVLTGRAVSVGRRVGNDSGLRDLALPVLNRLQVELDETVHLMTIDGLEVLLIERVDSAHTVRAFAPLGDRAPLHSSANGRCVLAHMPERDLAQHLAAVPVLAGQSAAETQRLRTELEEIRQRGYAFTERGHHDGVVIVAACIHQDGEKPVGSVSVFAPKTRLPRHLYQDYGKKIAAASAEIAAALPPRLRH